MKTVDNVIDDFKILGFDNLNKNIPNRDIKILKNISSLMTKDNYITENQGNLLLKILKENLNLLEPYKEDVEKILDQPIWKSNFRIVEKIRKVYIGININSEKCINLEATFDKNIKKVISMLNKSIGYDYYSNDLKLYSYLFNEKNIIAIYKILKPYKFHFCDEFLELHNKINQLDVPSITEKFNFYNFYNNVLKVKNVTIDIDNPLHILDKKIKYQYNFDYKFDQTLTNKLEYKIANRTQSKIFLKRSMVKFSDLYESLQKLDRNKILLIFDEFSVTDTISNLKLLSSYIDRLNQKINTGVYFRFDNRDTGKTFNQLISDKKLNVKLDDNTNIAVVSNGKMPKFMLKNLWYPDVVISFTNSLRNNKTDVYCSNCDLVIYYLDSKPLSIKSDEIL